MEGRRLLVTVLRWMGRILLVGVGLFLILVLFLLVRESITREKYRAEYPPQGQMIDLKTHAIHLHCTGAGSPTVVFEADLDQEIPDRRIRPLILLLSHLGMPGRFKGNPYDLPSEIYAPQQAFLPQSSMAWFGEKVEAPNILLQAGRYQYLGDLPLIVIATAVPPASMEDRGQVLQDLWLELQQELLLLSEQSEIRISEVGHYPQLQSPELVVEAIQDVLGRCAEAPPLP